MTDQADPTSLTRRLRSASDYQSDSGCQMEITFEFERKWTEKHVVHL